MAEVKVGDRSLTIPRFNGFKIVRATRIVKEISRKYPEIIFAIAEFTKEYEQKNAIRITRAMAKSPRFREYGFGAKDFEATGYIELPVSPTIQEQVFAVFPQIMDAAETELVSLLALILAPNSELADADENGTVDDYLKNASRKLLHEADFDQLIDIAVVAAEVLRDQMSAKLSDAGKAATAFMQGFPATDGNADRSKTNTPESSSGSPTPSDGIEEKSSIASAGKS